MPNLHPELLIPINGIDVMSIAEFLAFTGLKKFQHLKILITYKLQIPLYQL